MRSSSESENRPLDDELARSSVEDMLLERDTLRQKKPTRTSMEAVCAVCGKDHFTAECPQMQHCFVCDKAKCSCGFSTPSGLPLFAKQQALNRLAAFQETMAQECYRCGKAHCGMFCDLARTKEVVVVGTDSACVNCGSHRHQSAACQLELQNQLEYGIWFTAEDIARA